MRNTYHNSGACRQQNTLRQECNIEYTKLFDLQGPSVITASTVQPDNKDDDLQRIMDDFWLARNLRKETATQRQSVRKGKHQNWMPPPPRICEIVDHIVALPEKDWTSLLAKRNRKRCTDRKG